MIDWLTLRHNLSDLPPHVREVVKQFTGAVFTVSADEKQVRIRDFLDIESLRSDSVGIFWQLQHGGNDSTYLVVGASPASLEHGCNVFGSDDVQHCATVLLKAAGRALGVILPSYFHWSCRRMDITENYDLGSPAAVRSALRILCAPKVSSRNRVSAGKGDTVEFMAGAKRQSGIGYHKGPQLARLLKKHPGLFPAEYVELADSLLRLELRLKREYWVEFDELPAQKREFDRPASMPCQNENPPLPKQWFDFTPDDLSFLHHKFFDRYIGDAEVTDMATLNEKLLEVCPTKGQAKSAYEMYAAIRADGLEFTKARVSSTTWYRNLSHLYAAGLAVTDIAAGNVVQLRRDVIRISEPVRAWGDIQRAA